ncbi:radical SAM protein [Ruegeria sediminis]|uniref:radical SAM protein n=1 Tax=Ruegeria sediminis TaxID=2583820 RepID=UPI001C557011|nr:radical SAM protein [Ruegeria sediminis]
MNWKALGLTATDSPPFLIFFINSRCNMKCDHCFYWRELNGRDDLSFEEIVALSEDIGPVEILNLSGGEPFLRREFAEICLQFVRRNGVREIYVPSNGYYTAKTVSAVRDILENTSDLRTFCVELSLDGMPEFHDAFRYAPNSFRKAMETYDALAEIQAEDDRLQIHAISTATDINMDEIRMLTTFLYDRCPKMTHHNLAILRGDRKDPTLQGPALLQYRALYDYIRRLWADREQSRVGAIVEPLLQSVKLRAIETEQQVAPCRAGILTGVVYANGDVGICEQRDPIGNIRERPFTEIWRSHHADTVRRSIACKECFCTNEVFMWPSIVFQPFSLVSSVLRSHVWENVPPLGPGEKADYTDAARPLAKPPVNPAAALRKAT